MSIEITRELLDRYLRATDQGEQIEAVKRHSSNRVTLNDIVRMVLTHKESFQLGLCAAAENMLQDAREMRRAYAESELKVGRFDPPAVFDDRARLFLRAAGFDTPEKLAAWEAAK